MGFVSLETIKEKELVPGFLGRFVHTDNVTLAYWNIKKGAILPQHQHKHEQVTSVLEGEFELTIDSTTQVLNPGMLAVIPGNVNHSGIALTECRILDVFYPVREEYR